MPAGLDDGLKAAYGGDYNRDKRPIVAAQIKYGEAVANNLYITNASPPDSFISAVNDNAEADLTAPLRRFNITKGTGAVQLQDYICLPFELSNAHNISDDGNVDCRLQFNNVGRYALPFIRANTKEAVIIEIILRHYTETDDQTRTQPRLVQRFFADTIECNDLNVSLRLIPGYLPEKDFQTQIFNLRDFPGLRP